MLDTFLLFPYAKTEALNSSEATQRKAIDYMKWSPVKMEAIREICRNDENQTALSYYFTNFRFHTRWTGLNENDFTYNAAGGHPALMGYALRYGQIGESGYVPFESGSSEEHEEPVEIMQEYLDRITELCADHGIELLLVGTPSGVENVRKYNYVSDYAAEKHLKYINFNESDIYRKLEYDYEHDNRDGAHVNIDGARKIAAYIGEVLVKEYDIKPCKSLQHEALLEYYEAMKKEGRLPYITDFYEYLDAIRDERYVVLISVKMDGSSALDDRARKLLKLLGCHVDFTKLTECSYYAVLGGDVSEEKGAQEKLASEGTLRDGLVPYIIISEGEKSDDSMSSINIDGTEYSKNSRGMNFVVYSLDSHKVIDAVCFDTHEDLTASRE